MHCIFAKLLELSRATGAGQRSNLLMYVESIPHSWQLTVHGAGRSLGVHTWLYIAYLWSRRVYLQWYPTMQVRLLVCVTHSYVLMVAVVAADIV